MTNTDPTLTDEALEMIREEADAAIRDISQLPEGSQPLWFRTRE